MHNQSSGPSQAPSTTELDAAAWRKSSRSQGEGADCVELAYVPDVIGVRDSKDPEGPKLTFSTAVARAFADQIKRGTYDA